MNYDELKATVQESQENGFEDDVYFKLTPAALTEYVEGKEQYVIIDTSDRVYVRPEDASNYVSSKNLMEFLGKYGIVDYAQLRQDYYNIDAAKELQQLRNLLSDRKSLNDFM